MSDDQYGCEDDWPADDELADGDDDRWCETCSGLIEATEG
jgi:hypothetical protein